MDFFNLSSFHESKMNMGHIRELAGVVTSSYLNDNVPPATSIVKIAQAEELTPDNIATLAAESNKMIHTAKYASAGPNDKYHAADFPLANAKEILAQLQLNGGVEKIAVEMPAPILSSAEAFDPFKAFGVEAEPLDKTASLKHNLKGVHEKLALLKSQNDDALYMAKQASDAAERHLIKQAHQMIIQEGHNSTERLQVLGKIASFYKAANMTDHANPVLAKVAGVLVAEGMVEPSKGKAAMEYFMSKTADCVAPPELISENLKATVVNGKHPLYITLKTFIDRKNALNLYEDRLPQIQDKLHIVQEKIRAL